MRKIFILLNICTVMMIVAASCTRTITEHVYQDRYHTDTLRVTQLQRDSIYLHDSISVLQKGDTIFVTKTKNQYRYLTRTDTVYKARTDTVINTEVKQIEKPMSAWDKAKIKVGGYAITAIGLFGAILALWIIFKKSKHSDY